LFRHVERRARSQLTALCCAAQRFEEPSKQYGRGKRVMKTLSVLAGVMLALVLSGPLSAQVQRPLAPVATKSGLVAGQTLKSGVKAWYGIRYAKPPTGALRWASPQPIHWDGVWNADRVGPECIQTLRSHKLNQYFGEIATSEDCLYLNVWAAPSSTKAAKLPVIVFIHGGGITVGSGGMPMYSGENLAKRGAIMVTMNYRLRMLGWMAHPELTKEQGGHSGNYTLQDMTAALQWVKDNIEQFGGDPNHVVVMGESWGGTAVFELLMSPKAKGLFSGAVLDSSCPNPGGTVHYFCPFRENTLQESEASGLALQKALNAPNLAAMRDIAADKVIAQFVRAGSTIDGWFLPRPFQETIRTGQMNDVPLLWTSNGDDMDWGKFPFAGVKTKAEYDAAIDKAYGDKASQFRALYPASNDAEAVAAARRAHHDSGLQLDARTCTAVFRRVGAKSDQFYALFDHKEPIAAGVRYEDMSDYPNLLNPDMAQNGAVHNFDTAYWFGAYEAFNTLSKKRDFTDADRAMSAQMSDMLIAFAKTGNPSTGTIKLPPARPGNEQRVVLDRTIRVEKLNTAAMDWHMANPIAGHGPACVTTN
jgi:para-nitrobenzyl esterase